MDDVVGLKLKRALIKKQGCFSQLTEDEIDKLAHLFSSSRAEAGQRIVTEGDPVDSVCIIVKGTADVQHETIKDHVPHVEHIAILGPGDAIGLNETGFYSISGRRTATVIAKQPMELLILSMAAFHGFALSHSHVSSVMRKNAADFLGLEK